MFSLFQRELMIPVDKQGFVTDLLEESRKFLPVQPADKLRLVEIASYKINRIVPVGTSLDSLVLQTPKSYRIEVCSLCNIVLFVAKILLFFGNFSFSAKPTAIDICFNAKGLLKNAQNTLNDYK